MTEDYEQVARDAVLRALAAAPRSRAELAQRLEKREIPDEVAQAVLDRFTEVGLIDDAEYAAMLVRTRHAERQQTRRAISHELRRRGIPDEVAQAALAQISDDDERQAAVDLIAKRLRATTGLDDERRMRRIVSALGRKGYSPSLSFELVRAAIRKEQQTP